MTFVQSGMPPRLPAHDQCMADLILVLDDGEVVGMGRHEDLLSSCDIYREIYFSQFEEGGER